LSTLTIWKRRSRTLAAALILIPGAAFNAAAADTPATAPGATGSRDFRYAVEQGSTSKVMRDGALASLTATSALEEDMLQAIASHFRITLNMHCEDPANAIARHDLDLRAATLPQLVDAARGKTHTVIYRDAANQPVAAPAADAYATAFPAEAARPAPPPPPQPAAKDPAADKLTSPPKPPAPPQRQEQTENQGQLIVVVDAFPPGCASTAPVARRFVGDPVRIARGETSEALTVEAIAATIRSEGPLSRGRAVLRLRTMNEPAALTLAQQTVGDPNPRVMLEAARTAVALARQQDALPQTAQVLVDRFKRDPYLDLVIILAQFDTARAWPLIEELTRSPSKKAQDVALRSLSLSQDRRGIPWLAQIVKRGDTQEATQAALVIGKIGGPEAVNALADLMTGSESVQRRALALEGIALLPEAEQESLYEAVAKLVRQTGVPPEIYAALVRRNYVKPLETMLADPKADAATKVKALEAMAEANNEQLIDSMAMALTDPRPEIRRAAIESINRPAAYEAIPHLVSAARDGDPQVRVEAAKGLAEFGDDDETVSSLVVLVTDRDERVRKTAIESLARVGKPTDAMVAAYRAARSSSDPYVAKRASEIMVYWGIDKN
jgi:HEAT repeat protein/cell division septation protein DedD